MKGFQHGIVSKHEFCFCHIVSKALLMIELPIKESYSTFKLRYPNDYCDPKRV